MNGEKGVVALVSPPFHPLGHRSPVVQFWADNLIKFVVACDMLIIYAKHLHQTVIAVSSTAAADYSYSDYYYFHNYRYRRRLSS